MRAYGIHVEGGAMRKVQPEEKCAGHPAGNTAIGSVRGLKLEHLPPGREGRLSQRDDTSVPGIGVATAVFAVVEGVLRPVTPFRDAPSLRNVFVFRPPGRAPNAAISAPEALDALRCHSALIARRRAVVQSMAAHRSRGFLADGAVHHVTPHFFPMLGRHPPPARTPPIEAIGTVGGATDVRDVTLYDAITVDLHLKHSRLWLVTVATRDGKETIARDWNVLDPQWSPRRRADPKVVPE